MNATDFLDSTAAPSASDFLDQPATTAQSATAFLDAGSEPSFLSKVESAAARGVNAIGAGVDTFLRSTGGMRPDDELAAARNLLGRDLTPAERSSVEQGGIQSLVALPEGSNVGWQNKAANAIGGFLPAAAATLAGGPAVAAMTFGTQAAGAEQQASAAAGEDAATQAARARLSFAINAPAALVPGGTFGLTRPLARVAAQVASGAGVGYGTSAINDVAQQRPIDQDAAATNALLMGLLGGVHQAVGDQVQMRDLGGRWAKATGKEFSSKLEAFKDLKKEAEAAAKTRSDAEVAAAKAAATPQPEAAAPPSEVRTPQSGDTPSAAAFLDNAAATDALAQAAAAPIDEAAAPRPPAAASSGLGSAAPQQPAAGAGPQSAIRTPQSALSQVAPGAPAPLAEAGVGAGVAAPIPQSALPIPQLDGPQNPPPTAPTVGSQVSPAEVVPTEPAAAGLGVPPVVDALGMRPPARKSWVANLPAHPMGEPDLLDAIAEAGGLRSLDTAARREAAKQGIKLSAAMPEATRRALLGSRGEYDYPEALSQYPGKQLVHPRGLAPDELAQVLTHYGYDFGGDVTAMFAGIEGAVRNRARAKPAALAIKQEQKFATEVVIPEGRKARDRQNVPADSLRVGATFKSNKAEFRVIGVDPDTGAAILQDGPRYGQQIAPSGTMLGIDKRSLKQPPAALAPQSASNPQSALATPQSEDPFARRSAVPKPDRNQGDLFGGGETGGDTTFNLAGQEAKDYSGITDEQAAARAAAKAREQAQGDFGFARRLPPDTRVTVQQPFEFMGVQVPGWAQYDFFENGDNTRSAMPSQLAEEGYELPTVTAELPTAQFLAADLAGWAPGLPAPKALAAGFALREAQLSTLRSALPQMQERWRSAFERLAPGLARAMRLEFGDASLLVEAGLVAPEQLTGHEQAYYNIAERMIFIMDGPMQANPDYVTLLNMEHELAHVHFDLLPRALQERLVKQWRHEVATRTGPLYVQGKLRPGVAHGVEQNVREWYAEGSAWWDHQRAKQRIQGQETGPQPSSWLRQAYQLFRDMLAKIKGWLRSIGRLPPGWEENARAFRSFMDKGGELSALREGPQGFARRGDMMRGPQTGVVWHDKNGYANVPLAHLDKVRIVEMPELVALVREGMGMVPDVRKLRAGIRGSFSSAGPKIALDWRIFADSVAANKTLAHEIGHWIDYLPEGSLKRGNILGRLGTLSNYLRTTLDLKPTDPSKALTSKDRSAIRSQAYAQTKAQYGARPSKEESEADHAQWGTFLSEKYHELIAEEIDTRGLAKLDVVREELLALTDYWKPYLDITAAAAQLGQDVSGYVAYRESSKELYADAISVLFNSPATLKAQAPTFWSMWWDYLDRKPGMKAALFELQQTLHAPGSVVRAARTARMEAMFTKGDEIFMRKAAEREARYESLRGWSDRIRQDYDDIYHPLVSKARALKAQGVKLKQAADPDILFEEHPLADNRNYRMLESLWRDVVHPLEAEGFTQADLGRMLLLARVFKENLPPSADAPGQPGGRSNLANPLGYTRETARRDLLGMRYTLGKVPGAAPGDPTRFDRLQGMADRLHEILWASVEEAVEVGSYNRATFENVIKPNRGTYAAFAVLDYLDDFVPAGIRAQRGSFKDVANPLTTTVLKMVSLNRLNQLQKAKAGAVRFMQEFFPDEIKPADTYFDGKGQRAKANPDPDGGELEMLVDGHRTTYWVPKDVAQMWEGVTPARADAVIEALNLGFRKLFYPVFIQYNPAFQLALSPIRDMRRTLVNVPAGKGLRVVGEYLRNYASLFTGAPLTADATTSRAYLAGRPDGVIQEMMANSAIGLPYESFASGFGNSTSQTWQKMMERFHLAPPEKQGGILESDVLAPVRALLRQIEWAGLTMETLPKVSTYRILREDLKWSPAQSAAFVRNNIGVPNFRKIGRHTRIAGTLFPFFNVFLKGYQADLRLATGKQSRSGWWLRWAASSGGLRMIAAAGAAGLLGAAIKELYDGVSEYDKTNYLVVPIGRTSDGDFGGKTVYVRIPEDEISRLLGGILHKAITAAAGDSRHALTQLTAFGTEQTPSLNPILKIGAGWTAYLGGQNPMDGSRGVPILSNSEYLAGGWPAMQGMAAWTYNQTGVNNFLRYDTRANNWMEIGVSAVPGINRLLKVSDYGHLERQRDADTKEMEDTAKIRVAMPERVRRLYGEFQSMRGMDKGRMTPAQAARRLVLASWYNKAYKPYEEAIRAARESGYPVKSYHTALDAVSEAYERK